MIKPLRLKNYKARNPLETINKIRETLEKKGIFAIESHFNKSDLTLYSCRLQIANNEVFPFEIGVNGKGMSPEYSLASAYGEFMERLQNNALFTNLQYATERFIKSVPLPDNYLRRLKEKDLVLTYKYAPDEHYISIEDVVDKYQHLLENIFLEQDKESLLDFLKSELHFENVASVPFYNVGLREVENLPLELIRFGTNGMCSGNTPTEAIIQGICEIFERYVLKKIYEDEISPPTIDIELFNGTDIYKKIKDIEQNQKLSIEIKDCSLGQGLPVIGVIVYDQKQLKFSFHLGADPSPITALERCITELFQGKNENKFKRYNLQTDPMARDQKLTREEKKHLNFDQSIVSYDGNWPKSLFSHDSSYGFTGFEHPISESDEADLKYLVDKILDLGFDLYVRDVSFLGFPSFTIYIAGMSERPYFLKSNISKHFEFTMNSHIFLNIKRVNESRIEKLANSLDSIYISSLKNEINFRNSFLYNTNADLADLNKDLFIAMLFYRVKNYSKASEYIDNYISNIEEEDMYNNRYYFCLRDFFKLCSDNTPHSLLTKTLTQMYGADLTEEIMTDMENPADIFKYYQFPSCFDCDNCEIVSDCKYFDVLGFVKKIREEYRRNTPQQSELAAIFTCP